MRPDKLRGGRLALAPADGRGSISVLILLVRGGLHSHCTMHHALHALRDLHHRMCTLHCYHEVALQPARRMITRYPGEPAHRRSFGRAGRDPAYT